MAAAPPGWLTLPEDEFQDQYRPAHNATRSYLHGTLLRALGSAVERLPTDDELQQKPLVIDLARPLPNGELNALHWILELEAGEDARPTVASGYAAEVHTRSHAASTVPRSPPAGIAALLCDGRAQVPPTTGPRHCLPGRYLTSDTTWSRSLLMRRQAAAMLMGPCRRWRLTARVEADGEVAEGGHDLWAVTSMDLAVVLGEGHVPHLLRGSACGSVTSVGSFPLLVS
jgi:hypothetical protein